MGYTVDNMDRNQIRERIKRMVSPERFAHIENVEKTAVELANRFGVDPNKAALAALLHDAMRGLDDTALLAQARKYGLDIDDYTKRHPRLLHGPVAARWARQTLGISDREVLQAVSGHTVGDADMAPLTCILYLADAIEPARDYPGIRALRDMAKRDLYGATCLAVRQSEEHVMKKGQKPHPASARAVDALEKKMREETKR